MNRAPLSPSVQQAEPSFRTYERMALRHIARSTVPDEQHLDRLYQCQYNHLLMSEGVDALRKETIYLEKRLAKLQAGCVHGHPTEAAEVHRRLTVAEHILRESILHSESPPIKAPLRPPGPSQAAGNNP